MTNKQNGMMGLGLSFVTGCIVGGIAGLLAAPQSGSRTRRQLSSLAEDVREKAGEVKHDALAAVDKTLEQSRSFVGV